jgi:hypothetical protein
LFHFTALSGRAYELCGQFDDASASYSHASDGSNSVDSAAARCLAAEAHVGLGWICIYRWQQQQQQQQQQPDHKIKERIFQVAHVHFLTALKFSTSSAGSADAAITAAARDGPSVRDAINTRLYSGLALSLFDQR